jgi:dephospho-CoA kinase
VKKSVTIVAVTGMPGAGKSTAVKGLVALGWKRVVMGDVVRQETKRRGLDVDAKNTGEVMQDIRRRDGDAAVAKLCLKAVEESGARRVIVDGIRSMAEVEEFRKTAKVVLVAVHASPHRRYALLRERGRGDDPLTYGMFLERDHRELGVGIGTAIALADEFISNERSTPEALSKQMAETVNRWLVADAS